MATDNNIFRMTQEAVSYFPAGNFTYSFLDGGGGPVRWNENKQAEHQSSFIRLKNTLSNILENK